MIEPHSRGPWRWVHATPGDRNDSQMATLVDANEKHICDFGDCTHYYPTEGVEPSDANKALIATSPELLEALRAAETLFACHCKDSTALIWLENTRALIARATPL